MTQDHKLWLKNRNEVTYADVVTPLSDLMEMVIAETKLTRLQKLQMTYGSKSPLRDAMLQSKLDSVLGKACAIRVVAVRVICGICGKPGCPCSTITYKVEH
jgi:hypothetical protein